MPWRSASVICAEIHLLSADRIADILVHQGDREVVQVLLRIDDVIQIHRAEQRHEQGQYRDRGQPHARGQPGIRPTAARTVRSRHGWPR
jgi:hypothetical protein